LLDGQNGLTGLKNGGKNIYYLGRNPDLSFQYNKFVVLLKYNLLYLNNIIMENYTSSIKRIVSLVEEKTELELRIGEFNRKTFVPGTNKFIFDTILKSDLFNDQNDTTQLIVMSNNNKKKNIRRNLYLNSDNKLEKETFEFKEKIKHIDIPSKKIRISLSREEIIDKDKVSIANYNFFRFKKRISKFTKDNKWRYDFTKINEEYISDKDKVIEWMTNVKNTDNKPDKYELEIEYIGKVNKDDIIKGIDENINYIDKILLGVNLTGQDVSILSNIQNLFSVSIPYNNIYIKGKKPSNLNFKHDIINKATTLEFKHIKNIEKDYAVSPKADGERVLIYFDFNNNIYLLNNRNEVTNTKCVHPDNNFRNSLIDSEFINETDTLYAFDVLIFNGKDKTNLNLLDRIKCLDNIKLNLNCEDTNYNIKIKEIDYTEKKSIFEKSKTILEKKYDYITDGIVFTPIHADYRSKDKLIYKWKPLDMLSIDFLVKFPDDKIKKDNAGKTYKTVYLFVGENRNIFIKKRLSHIDDYYKLFPNIHKNSVYFPIHFHTKQEPLLYIAHLYTDKKDNILDYSNNPISIVDNSIVEFNYTSDNKENFKFVPLRNRSDRTKEYHNTNQITANNLRIAVANYEVMMDPITKDMIIGKEPIKEVYFQDIDDDFIKNMKRFHGFIKMEIYRKFIKNGSSLLELGGGRYNDLHKWIERKLDNVVVVDIDAKALEKGRDRLLDMKKRKTVPDTLNIVQDIGSDIIPSVKKLDLPFKQFDNVICNFAIHYTNNNEETFNNFFNNVDSLLKSGGHFIYSTMNGRIVFNTLSEIKKGEELTLYKSYKGTKSKIMELTKLYSDKDIKPFGQKIDVFVQSIGSTNKENLVDITFINKYFVDKGYKLIENFSFREKYNDKFNLSDAEKQYSFLNQFIVLEKK
jgi:ubiquinone/menaquinone biosynthesis C-methylase UbiE